MPPSRARWSVASSSMSRPESPSTPTNGNGARAASASRNGSRANGNTCSRRDHETLTRCKIHAWRAFFAAAAALHRGRARAAHLRRDLDPASRQAPQEIRRYHEPATREGARLRLEPRGDRAQQLGQALQQRRAGLEPRFLLALAFAAGRQALRAAQAPHRERLRLLRALRKTARRRRCGAVRQRLGLAGEEGKRPGDRHHFERRHADGARRALPAHHRRVGTRLLCRLQERAREVPQGGDQRIAELGIRREKLRPIAVRPLHGVPYPFAKDSTMNAVTQMLAPSATDMIRADHTRVLAAFHKYDIEARPATKRALVETVCFALEVHAQIEEEIFYPALRGTDSPLIDRFVPEHAEMRRLIASLRGTNPEDASDTQYDAIFMELMRSVMHHVADEETLLLPEAERVLGDEGCEPGA